MPRDILTLLDNKHIMVDKYLVKNRIECSNPHIRLTLGETNRIQQEIKKLRQLVADKA